MKKINLTEFIGKTCEHISLTEAERAKLLSVTKEYMALKPVRTELVHRRMPVLSLYLFARKPLAFALIAVLVVSSGAGISYAAENALPGDALYGVKVSVNEEVRALAAVTQESKAEWEATRAEKRLAEASALAAKGALTSEVETELMARFAKHADKAAEHVEKLEGTDAAIAIDVASEFETVVAAHVEILDEVDSDKKAFKSLALEKARKVSGIRASAENGIAVSAVPAVAMAPESVAFAMTAKSVVEDSSLRVATDVHVETDSQGDTERKNASSRMAKSASKSLAEAKKLFERTKARFSVEEQARAFAVITKAEEGITAGNRASLGGDFGTAFHAYQDAFVELKKLGVFLKTASKGTIKLRIHTDSSPVPLPDPTSAVSPSGPAQKEDERETKKETEKPRSADDSPLPTLQIIPATDNSDDSVDVHSETKIEDNHVDVSGSLRIRLGDD